MEEVNYIPSPTPLLSYSPILLLSYSPTPLSSSLLYIFNNFISALRGEPPACVQEVSLGRFFPIHYNR